MSKQRVDRDATADRVTGRLRLTRLESALDWAASLVPSPYLYATSCCGMSLAEGGDLFEALGSAPPAVSARSADLLIVAGTLTKRQVPLLQEVYDRMIAPRWVLAWGACAISGGPYQNYSTVSGVSKILPVDVFVRGCPPAPEDFRAALELLHERARLGSGGRSSEGGWLPIEEQRMLRKNAEVSLQPNREIVE